jgi:hypothetical protein
MLGCPNCGASVDEGAGRCARCRADVRVVVIASEGESSRLGPREARRPTRTLFVIAIVVGVALTAWLLRPADEATRGQARPVDSTSISPSVPAVAGDDGWSCPYTNRYVAYLSGRLYFPPNHPARPPVVVKPAACFATGTAAERAGYSLAPTPPGQELVAGIYLAPIDLTARCRQAARRLRFAVPCPTLVPSAGPDIRATCQVPSALFVEKLPAMPCVAGHAFVFMYQGFAVPPDYPTPFVYPDGTIHRGPSANLVIAAFIELHAGEQEPESFLDCPGSLVRGNENLPSVAVFGPIPAVYHLCLQGGPTQRDQLMLRWNLGRVTYQASLHEDTPGNRELLLRIASAIEYVSAGASS